MRVCIVLNRDLFEPWPLVRAMREVEVLREIGRDVSVVSWVKDESSQLSILEVRDGIVIRRVKLAPPKRGLARALSYRSIMQRLAREISSTTPNAVICHDLEVLWAAVMARRRQSIPILYHVHEDWPVMVSERSKIESAAFRSLERRLLKDVDHVYVVGPELAVKYRAMGKPTTIQYGSKALAQMPQVRTSERNDIRLKFGFAPSDVVVGLGSSLGTYEAVPELLDAIAGLPETIKVFFVGGLPDRVGPSRGLVSERHLDGRVSFTGTLPTAEYLRHLSVIDIGCVLRRPLSNNIVQAIPLKLFDYMGVGVPIVVSDFPPLRRIAVDSGFGIAVDAANMEMVKRALSELAGDPARRRAMSAAAIRVFKDVYSWERQEEALRASHPVFRAP